MKVAATAAAQPRTKRTPRAVIFPSLPSPGAGVIPVRDDYPPILRSVETPQGRN